MNADELKAEIARLRKQNETLQSLTDAARLNVALHADKRAKVKAAGTIKALNAAEIYARHNAADKKFAA